ncbi:hypothetical protein [Pedobacter soli]|uniref:Uncharacterized protein n=1 Tax=Pedobacter soli TaxID=390242 RepID=A0A1G6WXX4_9SPHI|nr:hypothetical protein [Pedobacter soli]SDD70654.1 hypothetical protein SAMN04488024_107159 [Pedobacter soli]
MNQIKRSGRRGNLVRCYLSDHEYSRLLAFATPMGITISELIRQEIIYGQMLDVNPAALLQVFTQIGADYSQINAQLQKVSEALKLKPIDEVNEEQRFLQKIIAREFEAVTECLTKAIRMMMIRMNRKRNSL